MVERDADPAGEWSTPWQHLAGLVLFVYLLVTMAGYVLADLLPSGYRRWLEWHDDLPLRLWGCLVVLAVLTHGLAGVRTVVLESVPSLRSRAGAAAGVVAFSVFAVGLPLCAVMLRPWFEAHIS